MSCQISILVTLTSATSLSVQPSTPLSKEVLLAPGFGEDALAIMKDKPNVRLLEVPMAQGGNRLDLKRVGGGLLVQSRV